MTKSELAHLLQNELPFLTVKMASKCLDRVFAALRDAIISEGKFTYPGFGSFRVVELSARKGINPRTKEPIQVPPTKTVKFKMAASFKEELNRQS